MGRLKTIPTSKLFPRGKKGTLYFRMRIDGKDKWISTDTSDSVEAKKIALSVFEAELKANKDKSAGKTAHTIAEELSKCIVKDITGTEIQKIKLADAQQKWIDMFPGYGDITHATRSVYNTIFKRFVVWCKDAEIEFLEEVTNEISLKYAKWLWETNLSPKTYNEHIKHLSRVFTAIDAVHPLPYNNPFSSKKLPRKKKNELNTEGHHALEPKQLKEVLEEAAKFSEDFRDLFALGANTGARLKDCALMQWAAVKGNFLEFTPFKTMRTGNTARVPISAMLRELLTNRADNGSEYIIPHIAEHYMSNPSYVKEKAKDFFIKALGINITNKKIEKHRKRSASIYSFHSFRTTFMSLLAQKDVSIRDAMKIMAWESAEMIKVYEEMLEQGKQEADNRALAMIAKIEPFNKTLPKVSPSTLKPTKIALTSLVNNYSNITIGKIYSITEAAIRKHIKKHGIVREKRIESADVTDKQIEKIREELKHAK